MEKYLLLILGAVIGFIASIAKDYFVEKTKKKNKDIELKREKAEELYILLEKCRDSFFIICNDLIPVLKKDIRYTEYLDKNIKVSIENYNFSRMEMLLKIYFKELYPKYKIVKKQMEEFYKIENKFALEKQQDNLEENKKNLSLLLNESLNINKLIFNLQEDIANIIKIKI
ncbi:conserved hypothetical protein [Aliarcobacter butzleri JV22]|uniref:hypothetical protein n=1 Tax=Aliarcobacter butzleri TaxID=28197 RepID=UPI0001F13CF9|nr:hypothetical protein [Aliarcobacter butzleri]EFU70563.1 conserved hypothetical protein [Aliarcobacter butzleri JV22]